MKQYPCRGRNRSAITGPELSADHPRRLRRRTTAAVLHPDDCVSGWKLTKSLRGIAVNDPDPSTYQSRGGPYTIEAVDPQACQALDRVIADLDGLAKDLLGIRDTAHHVDERINWKARRRPIVKSGGMIIGNFESGPPPTFISTAVDLSSTKKSDTTVPGYDARVELSQETINSYQRQILAVFGALPWDGPPPDFG